MVVEFIPVSTQGEIEIVERLADEIWREHYTAIIGEAQVNYMLEKFQSVDAIRSQVDEGYEYFIIRFNDEAVGYISVKQEEV